MFGSKSADKTDGNKKIRLTNYSSCAG